MVDGLNETIARWGVHSVGGFRLWGLEFRVYFKGLGFRV